MKRLATIFIALLCSAEAVIADAPEHPYGRLFVTAVNATEGKVGGASLLRLTVSNETGEDFHLQGVVTPVAGLTGIAPHYVARLGGEVQCDGQNTR